MDLENPRLDDDTAERTRREESTLRHWQSVSELLDHRTDLAGVHPMADLIYDAVRWTA